MRPYYWTSYAHGFSDREDQHATNVGRGFAVGIGAMIGILIAIFALVLGLGLSGWDMEYAGTLFLVILNLGGFALRAVRQANETKNLDDYFFFENRDDNVSDYHDGHPY